MAMLIPLCLYFVSFLFFFHCFISVWLWFVCFGSGLLISILASFFGDGDDDTLKRDGTRDSEWNRGIKERWDEGFTVESRDCR